MAIYDAVKDLLKTAQKADNIELYRQLLELGQQALDMQDEISKLKEEVSQYKKRDDLESRIVRHRNLYVTLKDDDNRVVYCSHCWDSERKLIQVEITGGNSFRCPHCRHIDAINEFDRYR